MAALAPAEDPAAMSNWLENRLRVTNGYMRDGLRASGFDNLASLSRQNVDDYAKRCCDAVRKGPGNQAARKNVPIPVEEGMKKLVLFVRYCEVTGRILDFTGATLDNLDNQQSWYDQCATNSPKNCDGLDSFPESIDWNWFDKFESHLESKIGHSGYPFRYVIGRGAVGADQGFGLPSFDEELMSRARHAGHYWSGDNKAVWEIIKRLCQGTVAWSTIKSMTNNGRLAHLTLLDTFMGAGVRRTLVKRALARLDTAVYDGKNRNLTWIDHVAMLRECFSDLEASGERNALSQEMQVERLVQSYQYQPLIYLTTTINNDPRYTYNFNAAVAFITTEMANIENRNVARGVAVVRAKESLTAEVTPEKEAPVAEDSEPDSTLKGASKEEESTAKIELTEKHTNDGKKLT